MDSKTLIEEYKKIVRSASSLVSKLEENPEEFDLQDEFEDSHRGNGELCFELMELHSKLKEYTSLLEGYTRPFWESSYARC